MRRFGAIAALAALSVSMAGAETITDRANRDEIARIAHGDPAMEKAFRKARETLPEFLALARMPRPSVTGLSVKIPIPYGDGNAEFFWIASFEERDGQFSGRINNTPRSAKSVRLGQTISFKQDDIVDWTYQENGRMVGNFTACAILTHEPRNEAEAFMKRFGLSCDF
jgi:uncharacterized protein YegJ (DUF2314 family)